MYLHFEKVEDGYQVVNDSNQLLCKIRKERVGRFLHWSMVIDQDDLNLNPGDKIVISPGCMDEIRAFCKSKNRRDMFESRGNIK